MTVTAATTPLATAPPPSAEAGARVSLSADLNTFLTLLTAQIRNQDPLEPADGTEYAAQLAQFSNVEQGVRTNELLSELAARLGGGDATEAARWIGLDVRHDGPVLVAPGRTTRLHLDIPQAADRAELVASDASGADVMRRPIPPGDPHLDWDGGNAAGGRLADGTYTLRVESYAGSQALDPRPVRSFARVEEVALDATGTQLVLEGGARIAPERLDILRAGT